MSYDGDSNYSPGDITRFIALLVAGFGSHDGDVVISMNNDVTSDNTGSDVVVIITRSADGIAGIKYRWESNE